MTPSRSHSCRLSQIRLSSTLSPSSTAWGSAAPVSAATHLAASTATPVSRRCGSGARFLASSTDSSMIVECCRARTSVLVNSLSSAPCNNCDAMVCGSAQAGVVAGRAMSGGGEALALRPRSDNASMNATRMSNFCDLEALSGMNACKHIVLQVGHLLICRDGCTHC